MTCHIRLYAAPGRADHSEQQRTLRKGPRVALSLSHRELRDLQTTAPLTCQILDRGRRDRCLERVESRAQVLPFRFDRDEPFELSIEPLPRAARLSLERHHDRSQL